jgi:hypothetical protein
MALQEVSNFKLSQDEKHLYIQLLDLHLTEGKEGECHIEGSTFAFYIKPYHLQLTFTHELNADGEGNRVVYKADRVTIRIEKAQEGPLWEGLEQVKADAAASLMEDAEGEDPVVREEKEEQKRLKEQYDKSQKDSEYAYGFGGRYSDAFRGKEGMLQEVGDLNPLEVPKTERMKRKLECEEESFDPERYAFDNFDDGQIA